MNNTGLVSISFRQLSPAEIINITQKSGLNYIEWGSDVHVPENDLENAKKIAFLTEESGIFVSSYGSYYRLGQSSEFIPYLKTAQILKAPIIRIWAGTSGSKETDIDLRKKYASEAKEIAKMAAAENIKINLEYHPGTLTDERKSALNFISEVNEPNFRLYWQPNFTLSHEENINAIYDVLEYVDIVHVFFWNADYEKMSLSEGETVWNDFIGVTKRKENIKYLLEFIKNDDPTALRHESEALKSILKGRVK